MHIINDFQIEKVIVIIFIFIDQWKNFTKGEFLQVIDTTEWYFHISKILKGANHVADII